MKFKKPFRGRHPEAKKPLNITWSRPVGISTKSPAKNLDRRPVSGRRDAVKNAGAESNSNFTNQSAIRRGPGQSGVNLSTVKFKKFRFQLKHLPTILFSLVIGFGLVYASSVDSRVRVALPSGNLTSNIILQSPETYALASQKLINQSLLNKSKITFNSDLVANKLKQQFPELKNVVVVLPLLSRRPVVQVSANPAALVLVSHGQATVIGADGRALMLASAASSSNLNSLPYVYDDADLNIAPGSVALPTATIDFLTEVIHQIKAKNLVISRLVMPKAVYELDVYLAGNNYYVKFNSLLPARNQAGAYFALQEQIASGKLAVPQEYIDVRVDDRAYLK